jgi:hypothetical protein
MERDFVFGKMSEGGNNVRVTPNELSVKVGKT